MKNFGEQDSVIAESLLLYPTCADAVGVACPDVFYRGATGPRRNFAIL
jgi:hypothetical protein